MQMTEQEVETYPGSAFAITRNVLKTMTLQELNDKKAEFESMEGDKRSAEKKKIASIEKVVAEIRGREQERVKQVEKSAPKKTKTEKQEENMELPEAIKRDIEKLNKETSEGGDNKPFKVDGVELGKTDGESKSKSSDIKTDAKTVLKSERGREFLAEAGKSITYVFAEVLEKLSKKTEYFNLEGLKDDLKTKDKELYEDWKDVLLEYSWLVEKVAHPKARIGVTFGASVSRVGLKNNGPKLDGAFKQVGRGYSSARMQMMRRLGADVEEMENPSEHNGQDQDVDNGDGIGEDGIEYC